MKYYLDTEFNGFGGALLSLGLAREDGKVLYMTFPQPGAIDPWVRKNVLPIMGEIPSNTEHVHCEFSAEAPYLLYKFFDYDCYPKIYVDWPDDITYMSKLLITGPGKMIGIKKLAFYLERVDAYPTKLKGAVQHNAAWDALALREILL